MKAPLLASHDKEGRQRSVDGDLIVLRGRGELFLAPKSFPSPPKLPHSPQNALMQNTERHEEERYSSRLSCSMDLLAASGVRTKKDKGAGTPAAYVKKE